MITVNHCCCGCTLRTGSIIIGFFYLIVSGAALCVYAAYSASIDSVVGGTEGAEAVKGVFITLSVIYAVQFVANVLLLVAVFADKPPLFFPWLVTHIIVCIVVTIVYLVAAIFFFMDPVGIVLGVLSIIAMIIGVGLQAYFILVVFSLYKEIRGQT